MEKSPLAPEDLPIEGAPTWIRATQAAVVGVVAGLALNALLSMVVVRGEGLADQQPPPQQKHCKKATQPKKDTAAPRSVTPTFSEVRWTIDSFVVLADSAERAPAVVASDVGLDRASFAEWRETAPAF